MPEDIEKLVEQYLKEMRHGMLAVARNRLAELLDGGQRDERDRGSDKAVYAACRAFCATYEELNPKPLTMGGGEPDDGPGD